MGKNALIVKNPYSGEDLSKLSFASPEEIRNSLDRANKAFSLWRNSTSFERSQVLNGVASLLEARKQEFTDLIRDEAGKPVTWGEIEVTRCLGLLRWAAAESQRFSGELLRIDTAVSGRPGFGINTRFPKGVILGITPFNFPLNLVAHKVAPAVAVGCAILIKPSPATPLTSLKFADLFREAGAPEGLVQVVLADDEATATLTRAAEIAMVSFTGSARVGHLIRQQAFDKSVTLELGGNAYLLVMEDIDRSLYPSIAKRIASGAFGYAGQSCISIQNVAAPRAVFGELQQAIARATENVAYGDPSDPKVVSGPVINETAARRLHQQLDQAQHSFETVRSSQYRARKNEATAPSLVVSPTLITFPDGDQDPARSPLVQEEIFGPVMTAASFDSLDEIIARVNSSRYGLQTGVFTNHWPTIEKLYRELHVGGLVVNDIPSTRYDHQPYGGVKESGQGREGVRYAMEEMTEAKFLALSSQIPG